MQFTWWKFEHQYTIMYLVANLVNFVLNVGTLYRTVYFHFLSSQKMWRNRWTRHLPVCWMIKSLYQIGLFFCYPRLFTFHYWVDWELHTHNGFLTMFSCSLMLVVDFKCNFAHEIRKTRTWYFETWWIFALHGRYSGVWWTSLGSPKSEREVLELAYAFHKHLKSLPLLSISVCSSEQPISICIYHKQWNSLWKNWAPLVFHIFWHWRLQNKVL